MSRSSSRSGDLAWSASQSMVLQNSGTVTPLSSGGGGGGGGGGSAGGPIRHSVGAQQNRATANKRSRDFGSIEPAGVSGAGPLNGMGSMSLNSSPMGGMTGLPGMNGMNGGSSNGGGGGNERLGWGGMVGVSPGASPYGLPDHQYHHQPHHNFQQQPYPGQHMAHLQQQHRMNPHGGRIGVPNGVANMTGLGGMAGMAGMAGINGMGNMNNNHGGGNVGPMSKKKMKVVAPVVKDKNCPKRPRNSYIFFTLMKRDDIKKKHPEFKPTEITKMLGEEWQKLSDSEKESYGTLAENDKKRYQSEMEAYDASNTGANIPVGGGAARIVDNMGWGM
ncbi:hypothetical protein BGZ46_000840 [Entomortierella lignicola]|nr:hypothetical protein BGZ46_000840 [Entomortierella lignicola]